MEANSQDKALSAADDTGALEGGPAGSSRSAVLRWTARLASALPYLLCVLAAMAALYPLSIHPTELHRDRFTSVHILVFEHLWRHLHGGDPTLGHFKGLNFPEGVMVKIVAWPVLGTALCLRLFTSSVVALNLAQVAVLALSGWATVAALRRLEVPEPGPALAGVAWSLQPFMINFLSNGQFENCTGYAYPMVLWAIAAGGYRGAAVAFLAMALTGYSSPYQAIPVGLMAGAAFLCYGFPRRLPILLAAVAGLAAPVHYFGARPNIPAPAMGPGPSHERIPVMTASLLRPTFSIDPTPIPRPGGPRSPSLADYRRAARATLESSLALYRNPDTGAAARPTTKEATHASYLGIVLSALAAVGALAGWRRPLVRSAVVGGLLSYLFALGRRWIAVPGLPRKIPLPWCYFYGIPALHDMGMTYRFVTGLMFALCVCAAVAVTLPPLLRLWRVPAFLVALVAGGAIVIDSLFFGPVKLPLQTFTPALAAGYAALPESGAVLDLPNRPRVIGSFEAETDLAFPATMALLHGRPLMYTVGGGPNALIRGLPLTVCSERGGRLSRDQIDASFRQLREAGVSYVAIHPRGLEPSAAADLLASLREVVGPPDAEGGGVVGYRVRSSAELTGGASGSPAGSGAP